MQEKRSFSSVSDGLSLCIESVACILLQKTEPTPSMPLLFVQNKAEGNCCLGIGPQDGALTLCLKHVGA